MDEGVFLSYSSPSCYLAALHSDEEQVFAYMFVCCACLFSCLFVCVFTCLFVCLPLCWFVSFFLSLPLCFACLFVCLHCYLNALHSNKEQMWPTKQNSFTHSHTFHLPTFLPLTHLLTRTRSRCGPPSRTTSSLTPRTHTPTGRATSPLGQPQSS